MDYQSDIRGRTMIERLTAVEVVNEQRHLENLRRLRSLETSLDRLYRWVILGMGSSLLTLISVLAHFFLGIKG